MEDPVIIYFVFIPKVVFEADCTPADVIGLLRGQEPAVGIEIPEQPRRGLRA